MIAIAAAAANGAIGTHGRIPWNLPSDLKHFRELTLGHTVIMGRRTYESLPNGALPYRRNIVLSSRRDFDPEDAETVHSVCELMHLNLSEPAFVIGGAEVYNLLLPYCEKIFLTRVLADYPEADAFLTNLKDWHIEDESAVFVENCIQFRFETYCRK